MQDLYLDKKLSNWKIGKMLNIPRSTIYRKLKEYKLIKDRATAHIVYPRKDFSGDLIEKAHMIGFRIGDLRVRKPYPKGKTIGAACGTTIPEQIDLIRNLFEKYGRVWVKRKGKKINCEAFLNESFSFLLSKKTPNWILTNEDNFFSFLAGFTDAEGHIGIRNKRAVYSLGNYDSKLLNIIYKKLKEYKIECNKPIEDNRKGKKNNEGYKYNQNYWHFSIHKKEVLKKLFKKLQPLIKHKNKIKALNRAIENIENRRKLNDKK